LSEFFIFFSAKNKNTLASKKLVYFIINKPYNVLSQFSAEISSHKTLKDLYKFPKDVYPIGRLDKDSEGLLLLSNDRSLNHKLLNPEFKHKRTYHAQIEGLPNRDALQELRNGIVIRLKQKSYKTMPANIRLLPVPPKVEERNPPIRYRKEITTSWLEMELQEGKNRQVRRMTAKAGHPTLRLIRVSIEGLELGSLKIGGILQLSKNRVYKALNIKND